MRIKVSLIDDDSTVSSILENTLRSEGMDILWSASSSLEALGALSDGAALPDVLLLDLSLPDISGREMLTVLRDVVPAASVVILSGFISARERDELISLGAEECLTKGGDIAELVRSVRRAGERTRDR